MAEPVSSSVLAFSPAMRKACNASNGQRHNHFDNIKKRKACPNHFETCPNYFKANSATPKTKGAALSYDIAIS